MNACTFPRCSTPASTRNRAQQDVCGLHEPVVVGTCDDLGDHKAHTDETSDQ